MGNPSNKGDAFFDRLLKAMADGEPPKGRTAMVAQRLKGEPKVARSGDGKGADRKKVHPK